MGHWALRNRLTWYRPEVWGKNFYEVKIIPFNRIDMKKIKCYIALGRHDYFLLKIYEKLA